jgi:choline dehydrogenase-like flavoprotein
VRWTVVGAGSAGCVVAGRLSEDLDRHVTLIEAGSGASGSDGDEPGTGSNFFDALALPGRTFATLMASRTAGSSPRHYQRGRGLGGSSAVNAMIALEGDPALYHSWGWLDTEAAWSRVAVPRELASEVELGAIDRALLASSAGASRVPLTRRAGRRVSAADAYLTPARSRPNLDVVTDAVVASVIIDGSRAIGVRLADGRTVEADHVVLSAGAIHSPAILLRSDVRTPGIGDGLQDHPSVAFTLRLREPVADPDATLVTATVAEQGGVQILPLNHLGAQTGVRGFGALMAAIMRPKSRAGTVRLASPDPLVDPDVRFELLADGRDLDALVGAADVALGLLAERPFTAVVDEVLVDQYGTTSTALRRGDSLRSWVEAASGDYVHASSTCAMGRVVDADGRVFGYDGLYVCDASVFPAIPDANTNLPTMMLAERLVARWMRD